MWNYGLWFPAAPQSGSEALFDREKDGDKKWFLVEYEMPSAQSGKGVGSVRVWDWREGGRKMSATGTFSVLCRK